MGYDYDQQFLDKHKETIKVLIDLLTHDEVAVNRYDTHADLERARLTIRNIITSLAINFPEQFKAMRTEIRTWQDRDDTGVWRLYIGRPKHKIRGGVQGTPPVIQSQAHAHNYGPARVSYEAEVMFDTLIEDAEGWDKFIVYVAKMSLQSEVKVIKAEFLDAPDNMQAMNMFVKVGWTTEMQSPTTLRLSR